LSLALEEKNVLVWSLLR